MADGRLRQLECQWKHEPTDANAHARYLSALLRMGQLDLNRILAAALWGHKGARAMLAGDIIKSDAIIYNNKRISIIETRDVIRGSEHLSSNATRRIALGIIKLCLEHLVIIERTSRQRAPMSNDETLLPLNEGYSSVNVDLGTAIIYIEAYLDKKCTSDQLWAVLRKTSDVAIIRQRGLVESWEKIERRTALHRIIYSCCTNIAAGGNSCKIPLMAVAWVTDEQILKAVRAELYPWALGDAR